MDTENKIKTYEEIFDGISKTELLKSCRKRALYEKLIDDKISYKDYKKCYKNRIKLAYRIYSNTIRPSQLPGVFVREWRREMYYLVEDCNMLIEWAKKSEKDVRKEAREYLRERQENPFSF